MRQQRLGILAFAILLLLTLAYFVSYIAMGNRGFWLADPPHNKVRVFRSAWAASFFKPARKLESLLTGERVFTCVDNRLDDYTRFFPETPSE